VLKIVDASDLSFRSSAEIGAFKGPVKNLSNNDYHALKKYWSSTDLKFMASSSPAHFKEQYFSKIPKIKKTTDAMLLGSLVHTMLLTPGDFGKEFFIIPNLNLRTNEGKATKEKLLTENPNKLPITDELLIQANSMRSAAKANPKIMELLEKGLPEVAFFWTCPFSGLNFKAKLDQSSVANNYFCELKTTSDASPNYFSKHVFDMNYDLSLVHYREGLKQCMGIDAPAYFIVIEQDEPHVTQVYKVGDGYWATGHDKWLSSVTKLEQGIKKEIWPGYFPETNDIPELNPPAWAMNKLMKEELHGV